MLQALKRCLKDETGQGMTEYVLILVLVALAAITAFVYFRRALRRKINFAAQSLDQA